MRHDIGAAKRWADSKRSSDPVTKTPIEGPDVPALACRTRHQLEADIARGCQAHEQYLADDGSLADAVRSRLGTSL